MNDATVDTPDDFGRLRGLRPAAMPSWRQAPASPAATILPERGAWRARERGTATAWVAEASPLPEAPPLPEASPLPEAPPFDETPPPDDEPPRTSGDAPRDIAPPDDAEPDGAPPDVPRSEPSAAEIIAGTFIPAQSTAVDAGPSPSSRCSAHESGESLRGVVDDLHARIDRASEELRAMVAGHRAEVAAARSDFAPIRDWLAGARASVERDARERAERSGAPDRPPSVADAVPTVPVDPMRIMASATGRIGLPARHAAAAQEWATGGHRGTIEVTHPGARRRVGVAAAVYAATLGWTVRAVVTDRDMAESWRADLAAHAPELDVSVAGSGTPLAGRPDVVVTVATAPTDADPGGATDRSAPTLLVLGTPALAAAADPRCPWRLVLSGPGEWEDAEEELREHVDHRLTRAD